MKSHRSLEMHPEQSLLRSFGGWRCTRPRLLAGLAFAASLGVSVAALDVWTPRPHNPQFVEPGGSFRAEIRAGQGLSAAGWSAALRNDLASWNCAVASATWGRIHHGTEDGWILQIIAPANVSPELMDLQIGHASGGNSVSARGVQVVPDFERDFYILHQSDHHIVRHGAVTAAGRGQANWATGSTEAMLWIAPAVNLINPRFVLYTGDNMQVYFSAADWAGLEEAKHRCQLFLEALGAYRVATPVTTGNHDIGYSSYIYSQEWRAEYARQIGQRAWSFRMGSFYVLGLEWTYKDSFDWAQADYQAAFADPTVQFRLIATHYYDGLGGWTTVAKTNNPASLLLAGHNHSTRTLQTFPYPVLTVTAALDYQRAGFFAFQRTANGWFCPQISSHGSGNVHNLHGDWGSPRVSANYAAPNNGTATLNSVVITNALPHDFHDGRVRFLMAPGSYSVTGGEILAQYAGDAGSNTAVLVRVNIRAGAATTVSISERTPFHGAPLALPGRIETEDYDVGGPGFTYHDTTAGNSGGAYRQDNVDIEATSDAGGGYNVGWIKAGEWLEYTVIVAATGAYDIRVRAASRDGGGTLRVEFGGADAAGPIAVPATGAWQTWTTVVKPEVRIEAGTQIMRVFIESGDFNLNYFEVVARDASSGFAAWAGDGVLPTPALVQSYALGGAAAPAAPNEPLKTEIDALWLSLSAIVRTNDPKLTIQGHTATNLMNGPWVTNGVQIVPRSDQTGVPQGCERREHRVERGDEPQKFLHIKAILAQ